MSIGEGFPLLIGLFCGALLGLVSAPNRVRACWFLAAVGGTLATVANNELSVSWTYLFVDILEVAISIAVGWFLAKYGRLFIPRRASRWGTDRSRRVA